MNQIKGERGQFVKTTGSTKYRKVQYEGKGIGEHTRNVLVLLGLNEMPKGFVIHHIDNDKKNNDIHNLAILTHTAHNRIHSKDRPIWNKGKTAENSEEIRNLLKKAVASRKGNYLNNKCKPIYEMFISGKRVGVIAREVGLSRATVSLRIKRYKEYINK
jgi:DNA-binding NarL/FixJ family response regulator